MGLPQSNARLLRISAPGASEDFDNPGGGEGTRRWSGDADAYATESILVRLSASPGSIVRAKDMRLIIPADLRPSVEIHSGDFVTFTYAGRPLTGKTQDFVAKIGPQWATVHESVQLHFEAIQL